MRLDPHRVFKTLQAEGVTNLYHANSVRTSCSFLRAGGLLSRGSAERLGWDQTPQPSDDIDKQVGVWNDIFLDGVDIHDRTRGPNEYGPVLFVFSVELLLAEWLPPLWVTRDNPMYWPNQTTPRYFVNEAEFEAEYRYGDFAKMITLRWANNPLPFAPYLRAIVLDDPKLMSGRDINGLYLEVLRQAALSYCGQDVSNLFQIRRCRVGCRCRDVYDAMDQATLLKFFGT